jgi:hypothetical protein
MLLHDGVRGVATVDLGEAAVLFVSPLEQLVRG